MGTTCFNDPILLLAFPNKQKSKTKTLNPKMTLSYLREMSPCNLISSETSDSLTFIYPVFRLILCLVPYPAKPLARFYNLFLYQKKITNL